MLIIIKQGELFCLKNQVIGWVCFIKVLVKIDHSNHATFKIIKVLFNLSQICVSLQPKVNQLMVKLYQ